MSFNEIFYILTGWVVLITTVILSLCDASDAIVVGGFILSIQSFMYSDIEEIKGMLK